MGNKFEFPMFSPSFLISITLFRFVGYTSLFPFATKLCFISNDSLRSRAGPSLFFSRCALRSIFIHGSLSLILPIFKFAHGSIVIKKPVVCSWKRALKRLIAPETQRFALFKIRALPLLPPPPPPSVNYICM